MTQPALSNTCCELSQQLGISSSIYITITDSCCTQTVNATETGCYSLLQITHAANVRTNTHSPSHSLSLSVELLMLCVVLTFGEYQGSCRVMERGHIKKEKRAYPAVRYKCPTLQKYFYSLIAHPLLHPITLFSVCLFFNLTFDLPNSYETEIIVLQSSAKKNIYF